MPRYRLFLLDASSKATGVVLERRCATDQEALSLAMDVVEQHPAVEVWADERVIGRVTSRDAQAQRERMRGRDTGLLVNRGTSGRAAQYVSGSLA